MNCENCGAPMRAVDGQRHLFCDYCNTQAVATPFQSSVDGLKPTAEPSTLQCPDCPTGGALTHGLLDEQKVEFCSDCLGVWLETEDFSKLVSDRRMAYTGPSDVPAPVNQDALKRRRECPECHAPMESHPYYGPGNVVVDSCGCCQKLWLDHGELTTIVRAAGRRGHSRPTQFDAAKRDEGKTDSHRDGQVTKYEWQAKSLFEKAFDIEFG